MGEHNPMNASQAKMLISAERRRQVQIEGWTELHDDEHADGEMAKAAAVYHLHAIGRCSFGDNGIPIRWPWEAQWWKPKDPSRDLMRAGALYMAEKERLRRLPGSTDLKLARSRRMDKKIEAVVQALVALDAAGGKNW